MLATPIAARRLPPADITSPPAASLTLRTRAGAVEAADTLRTRAGAAEAADTATRAGAVEAADTLRTRAEFRTTFRPTRMAQSFHGFGGFGGRHRSDIRLKEDIVPVARLDNGIGVYRFRYKGNDHTVYVGVMAQEVPNDRAERRLA